MSRAIRRLCYIVLAAAIVVPGALAAQVEPPPLPERSDLARVVAHPDRGEMEVVIGPVSLPARGPHLRIPIQLVTLPEAGWLHGFDWEMRDAAGRELPERLLHHVNLIDPDNRELFAPVSRRVVAAGRETSRERIPRLLGYPLAEGTRFLVSAMFANPTDRDVSEAYLHVRLFYSAERNGFFNPRTVFPFYLDVMGLVGAEKDFPVPPGRSTASWEASPAIDARILGIGGHVHDYATRLRLLDVTSGKVIWEVEPVRDERGRVSDVPSSRWWWRGGVRIHRDRVYRIEVEYDNPTDRPAPDGGMGAIGGIVLASSKAEWPELDRRSSSYARDLRYTLEKPHQAHDHGHGHGDHDHGHDGRDDGPGGHDHDGHPDEGPGGHDHGGHPDEGSGGHGHRAHGG